MSPFGKIFGTCVAAIGLIASCWAITAVGLAPYGERQDRTVGAGPAARLAAKFVSRPEERQKATAGQTSADVDPLEFIGPFASHEDVKQVFEAMRRHRGVAQGIVCSVVWSKVDAACEHQAADPRALADALGVRLCRLTASKGAVDAKVPACSAGGQRLLVALMSNQANVVVSERRGGCARRACQIDGW
mgnify:CR=1 FL=1